MLFPNLSSNISSSNGGYTKDGESAPDYKDNFINIDGVNFLLNGYSPAIADASNEQTLAKQKEVFFTNVDECKIYAQFDANGKDTNHIIILEGQAQESAKDFFQANEALEHFTKDDTIINKIVNSNNETCLFLTTKNGNEMLIMSNEKNVGDYIIDVSSSSLSIKQYEELAHIFD